MTNKNIFSLNFNRIPQSYYVLFNLWHRRKETSDDSLLEKLVNCYFDRFYSVHIQFFVTENFVINLSFFCFFVDDKNSRSAIRPHTILIELDGVAL